MNNEVIDIIIADKARKEVQQTTKDILEADKAFLEFASNIKAFSKAGFKIKSPKQYVTHINEASNATRTLTNLEKQHVSIQEKIIKQYNKKVIAGSKLNTDLQRQRIETNLLNKEAREQAILTSKLTTFYQKQSTVLNRLTRRRQDLLLKQNLGIKLDKKEVLELKKLTAQQVKLDKALKKTDASNGRNFRSVGKYANALRGLTSVVGTLVGVYGVFGAIQLGRDLFNEIKEIDGLNKALLQVTETQTEFNQQQRFLVNLSEEAGVEINGLQKSYTKFLASAKTTNLTNKETQNIFRQTAKAGAVLGLSTDDLNGSFRALEQILSKGKVQAEEIRGQLGERLPGAFQILAQSMGLTTAQLSKQLELGNVLSEEVLPKFAEELEKVYGLDQVKKVDTLQAAQNRLGNEWNLFIRSIDSGEGVITKTFKTLLESTSEIIKAFRVLNGDNSDMFDRGYKAQLDALKNNAKITGVILEDLAKKELVVKQENLILLNKEIEKQKEIVKQREKAAGTNFLGQSLFKGDAELVDSAKDQLKILEERKAVTEGQIQAISELTEKTKGNTEAEIDSNKKANETLEQRIKQISILQQLAEQAEKTKTELSQLFQLGLIDAAEFSRELDKINNAIKDLTNLTQSATDLRSDATITADTSGLLPIENTLNALKEGLDNLEWGDALDRASEFFGEIGNFASALRDRNIQAIEDEINANDLKYANILNNEQLTQDQRNAIEAEQEIRRQELEKKKREEQAKQAKTQKAFSAAQVITNTAVAISKTLAETGVFGIPLTAIVAAQGALQLATVLAQPIPQYKDGRKGGKKELAITGDGGKSEAIVDRLGRLKSISPDKPTLTQLEEGDSVIPSMSEYYKKYDIGSIMNTSIAQSAMDQEQKLANYQININNDNNQEYIAKSIEKAISRMPRNEPINYNKLSKANYYENRAHKA